MRVLFLDDDLSRHKTFIAESAGHDVTYVMTAEAAISMLSIAPFDVICLDHDLGGETYVSSYGNKPTGYTVAKWMAEKLTYKPRLVVVHSFNQVGAGQMLLVLKGAGFNAFYVPFSLLTLRNL